MLDSRSWRCGIADPTSRAVKGTPSARVGPNGWLNLHTDLTMKRTTLTMGLVALFAGCSAADAGPEWFGTVTDSAGIRIIDNPREGIWTPETTWRLTEELRIGELAGDEAYQFGSIVAIDVDANGNLFVLDQQAAELRVFDAAGSFLYAMGGPGSGPGELGPAGSAVLITDDGGVLVPDLTNARLNRYGLDGMVQPSVPLDIVATGIPLRWKLSPDQRVLAQLRAIPDPEAEVTEPQGDPIVTFSDDGSPADTALVLPPGLSFQAGGGRTRIVLFSPEPVWDVGADGSFATAMNDAYRVEIKNAAGELTRILQRGVDPTPVTDADVTQIKELFRRLVLAQGAPPAAVQTLVERLEFAENYPAFLNLLVAPDRSVWLQHVRTAQDLAAAGAEAFDPQDLGSNRWDVFDGEGRYLGLMEFPVGFTALKLLPGKVYGTWKDDLGVPYVMVLAIEDPAAATEE